MKTLRDRIKELRRVPASELASHPFNWRVHPTEQIAALNGILGEVGMADALLAFPADGKGPNGDFAKLMVFDGHARKDRDPNQVWPVIVTDLTRKEADKMLAVRDPLSAMAGTDAAALESLLGSFTVKDDALQAMLDSLTARNTPPAPPESPTDFPAMDENLETQHTCPRCSYQWSGGK